MRKSGSVDRIDSHTVQPAVGLAAVVVRRPPCWKRTEGMLAARTVRAGQKAKSKISTVLHS